MAVERIDLERIHDNPYQARLTYHKKDIDDLAHSIKTHGLLQVPPGRRKDGDIELGFGHLRKRAFAKLAKKDPETFGKMPVDIRNLTDGQMAMFVLEENLKRRDITPLEIARAVDNYLNSFLEKTEVEVAEYLNMTKGNVSNMRRVLRLPEKILEKIDEGRITFTQGRELLTLEGLENAENLMASALGGLRTGNKPYGHANTVEGMQASIHDVISSHCRPLDKEYEGYRWDLIFDTRAAGCLNCDKMVRTHPTKSATAHYCLDNKCWDRHQEEQQQKVSAEAKATMEADILRRAAQTTAPAQVQERRELKTVTPVVVDEGGGALPVPCESCAKAETCDRTHFHVSSENSTELVCEEKVERAPEEVKLPTPEVPEDILALAREKAGTRAEVLDLKDIGAGYYEEVKQGYALLDGFGRPLEHILDPEECLERCTHGFHFAFDSRQREARTRYVCSDTKCLAKKKAAFTRAKNAEGQARKNAERSAIKEAISQTTIVDRARINLILLAQIDGHHTTKHYYGPTDGKQPETWLWDKLSAGTPAIERKRENLFRRIDKLSDEDLAKLVVEFMFYYLTDKGDIGTYEIKTTEPLKWMGIDINVEAMPEGDKTPA